MWNLLEAIWHIIQIPSLLIQGFILNILAIFYYTWLYKVISMRVHNVLRVYSHTYPCTPFFSKAIFLLLICPIHILWNCISRFLVNTIVMLQYPISKRAHQVTALHCHMCAIYLVTNAPSSFPDSMLEEFLSCTLPQTINGKHQALPLTLTSSTNGSHTYLPPKSHVICSTGDTGPERSPRERKVVKRHPSYCLGVLSKKKPGYKGKPDAMPSLALCCGIYILKLWRG